MDERRRPRVLTLTSTLPRWDGDSEPRFVLDLARHLGDHIDVELLAPHAPGAASREVLEGVAVTRFRYWIPRWQSMGYEGGITWRLKENPLRRFQVPFKAGFQFQQQHSWALRLTYELESPRATIYRMVLEHIPDGVYKKLRRAFPTLIYLLKPTAQPLE